jgi:hypothetical protein
MRNGNLAFLGGASQCVLLSSLSAKQLRAIDLRDVGVGAVSATRLVKVPLQLSGEIRKFEDSIEAMIYTKREWEKPAETLIPLDNCLCS